VLGVLHLGASFSIHPTFKNNIDISTPSIAVHINDDELQRIKTPLDRELACKYSCLSTLRQLTAFSPLWSMERQLNSQANREQSLTSA